MKHRVLSKRAMEIRDKFPSVFEKIHATNKWIKSRESYYHILYKLCKVSGQKLAYKKHKDMIKYCNQESKHRDTPKNEQDLDDRAFDILKEYQETGELFLPMYIYTSVEKRQKRRLEQNTYQKKNHKKGEKTWKF
ncbi:hypothetical protein VA249_16200 [Vibrio alfacsensis]|uniref:hypothetical protein n=1 Tax=Vibrio alfacsensis TaxID=1074311 RepID=UPI001BEE71C2|nr:hypothetical protein [Vibrio alfacsensis]BBM64974.1 hypothetical protein VA249_16200 [Vibrio alfacsensis]